MSQFNAEFYQQYRPSYPVEVFSELPGRLQAQGFLAPYQIADIGCGTGLSTWSLLQSGISARVYAVEPDPEMLKKARQLAALQEAGVCFVEGTGEATTLPSSSMDAVLSGSAFHWMEGPAARDEFIRILRPLGHILIFEYQFPKSVYCPQLNEWIRRQFNQHWKAPAQKPRGDFEHVTRWLREDTRLATLGYRRVPMELNLNWNELSGLLLSQSRVLHFENSLPQEERASFHESVRKVIREHLGVESTSFNFMLCTGTFALIKK